MSETNEMKKPILITPQEGAPIRPFGLEMYVMLPTEATGGELSAILAHHEPGKGPKMHIHYNQDEYAVIIDGLYEFTIGDSPPRQAGPGTVIYVPRGNWHGFTNIGPTKATMLDWTLPGGQDRYFRRCSDLGQTGFSSDDIVRVSAEHDTFYKQ